MNKENKLKKLDILFENQNSLEFVFHLIKTYLPKTKVIFAKKKTRCNLCKKELMNIDSENKIEFSKVEDNTALTNENTSTNLCIECILVLEEWSKKNNLEQKINKPKTKNTKINQKKIVTTLGDLPEFQKLKKLFKGSN